MKTLYPAKIVTLLRALGLTVAALAVGALLSRNAFAAPDNLPSDVRNALDRLPDARVASVGAGGMPTFLRGNLGKVIGAPTEAGVRAALPAVLAAFRVRNEDLKLERTMVDDLGMTHFRFSQIRNNMPVIGASLSVHIAGKGTIYAADGNVSSEASLPTAPNVATTTAESRALAETPDAKIGGPTVLLYVVSTEDHSVHLAYQVELTGIGDNPLHDLVYIDALTGSYVTRHPLVYDARNRQTYNANYSTALPGTLVRSEGAGPTGDGVVDMTYDNVGFTYDFYWNILGRDSMNNAGMSIVNSVHYSSGYNNAFWNGSQVAFGDGDGVTFAPFGMALDVVAHEVTHGVTQYSSNLIYQNESGALNEAVSDIMGAMCEAWADGAVSAATWMVGEDIYTPSQPGDALRYMNDPAADGASRDYYPDRYVGGADNGGVHWNSGIANLAFKLLVTGGTHPRGKTSVNVTGIGANQAEHVFYRANVVYAGPSSTFSDFRAATVTAAQDLYGSAAANAVGTAWDAVGVGGSPSGTAHQLTLRAYNGMWVTAEGGGGQALYANRKNPYAWETFTLYDTNAGSLADGDDVVIRASGGQYVTSEGSGQYIFATKSSVGALEHFTIHRVGGGGAISSGDQITLQTSSGYYWTGESGTNGIILADRTAAGPWEDFRLYLDGAPPPPDRTISLQSDIGRWVTAQNGTIYATATGMGSLENFVLVDLNAGSLESGDTVTLYAADGRYLCAEGGGGQNVVANRALPGAWERFTVWKVNGSGTIVSGNTVALQASNGNYWCAEGGGGSVVNANRTSVGPWEKFVLVIH
jgi:Zn-dependent metalloprotease